MKIGEIWIDRKLHYCASCPDEETKVEILGFEQGEYAHNLQFVHRCTGINKIIFNSMGYGDIVVYKYVNGTSTKWKMAREAFILIWKPCYELVQA